MSQDTRHLVRDQINVLRDSEQLPFCDLLDAGTIQKVLDQEGVSFRDTLFTPMRDSLDFPHASSQRRPLLPQRDRSAPCLSGGSR